MVPIGTVSSRGARHARHARYAEPAMAVCWFPVGTLGGSWSKAATACGLPAWLIGWQGPRRRESSRRVDCVVVARPGGRAWSELRDRVQPPADIPTILSGRLRGGPQRAGLNSMRMAI